MIKSLSSEQISPSIHAQTKKFLQGIAEDIKEYLLKNLENLEEYTDTIEIEGLSEIILKFKLLGDEFTIILDLFETEFWVFWKDSESYLTKLEDIQKILEEK